MMPRAAAGALAKEGSPSVMGWVHSTGDQSGVAVAKGEGVGLLRL